MQYLAQPTVHLKIIGQSVNQRTAFQAGPLYWSGEPRAPSTVWSPKTVNQISLKARGSIGENLTSMAPAANSTSFLTYKRFLSVRRSDPQGYTSGRAVPGLFAPTSMANMPLGRTNI